MLIQYHANISAIASCVLRKNFLLPEEIFIVGQKQARRKPKVKPYS